MRNFSKAELAGSLAIPVLTFLWGLTYTINRLSWGAEFLENGSSHLAYPIAMIFGGALPIFLTLKYKIHTEDYLKKRILLIIFIRIVFSLIGMIGKVMPMFIYYMPFGIGAIIFEVFRIQDEGTTGGERAVLMLSDPIIYWTIENFIMFFIDIIRMGPLLKYNGW